MYECKVDDTDIHTLRRVRHVCMYVCMYCMYVLLYAYMYLCMYVLHVCTECLYVYMYVCMNECMYVCMYVCMAIIRRPFLIPWKRGVQFDFHEWILHGLEVERSDISNSNHNQLHVGLSGFLWTRPYIIMSMCVCIYMYVCMYLFTHLIVCMAMVCIYVCKYVCILE